MNFGSPPASPQRLTFRPALRAMSRDLRDEAQDGRMTWIVESGDRFAVARRRHDILRQIVRAD